MNQNPYTAADTHLKFVHNDKLVTRAEKNLPLRLLFQPLSCTITFSEQHFSNKTMNDS
jgi:hypothetical protein